MVRQKELGETGEKRCVLHCMPPSPVPAPLLCHSHGNVPAHVLPIHAGGNNEAGRQAYKFFRCKKIWKENATQSVQFRGITRRTEARERAPPPP